MAIDLKTNTDATPGAAGDGTLYRALASGKDIILTGCVLSVVDTSKIKITDGYLLVCGRVCKVTEQSITVDLASSGTQTKTLYATVSPEGTPTASLSSTSAGTDDINADETGDYSAVLATYTCTTTAVTAIAPQMFEMGARTVLFSGGATATSGTVGNLITPAADPANFKSLIIAYRAQGTEIRTVPIEKFAVGVSLPFRNTNLGDASGIALGVCELVLKRNAATFEIMATGYWTWSGDKDEDAARAETNSDLYVDAIYGVYT